MKVTEEDKDKKRTWTFDYVIQDVTKSELDKIWKKFIDAVEAEGGITGGNYEELEND